MKKEEIIPLADAYIDAYKASVDSRIKLQDREIEHNKCCTLMAEKFKILCTESKKDIEIIYQGYIYRYSDVRSSRHVDVSLFEYENIDDGQHIKTQAIDHDIKQAIDRYTMSRDDMKIASEEAAKKLDNARITLNSLKTALPTGKTVQYKGWFFKHYVSGYYGERDIDVRPAGIYA